jgi:hypothetical protein
MKLSFEYKNDVTAATPVVSGITGSIFYHPYTDISHLVGFPIGFSADPFMYGGCNLAPVNCGKWYLLNFHMLSILIVKTVNLLVIILAHIFRKKIGNLRFCASPVYYKKNCTIIMKAEYYNLIKSGLNRSKSKTLTFEIIIKGAKPSDEKSIPDYGTGDRTNRTINPGKSQEQVSSL